MHAAALPTLLLAVAVLTGCVQDPAHAGGATSETLRAAPELGSIAVTVTTNELQPVAGAQVTLTPLDRSLLTDSAGAAVFDGLEVGQYAVVAAKPGHSPREPRGRLVDVIAGEVTKASLILTPLEIANASSAYHLTSTFRGFLSCSVSAASASASSCRGVAANGVSLRDPNDNSIHELLIENPRAHSAVIEARWTPTAAVFAPQMHLSLNRIYKCSPGCSVDNQLVEARGASPLYAMSRPDGTIGSYVPKESTFPAPLYLAMRTSCQSGCTASIAFQQSYEAFGTVFYYAPAPAEFRFIQG